MDVSSSPVVDNRQQSRFEVAVDGHVAMLVYERRPPSLVLVHTEVPPELRGRHLGDVLMKAAIDASRSEGLHIVPVCPFAKAYLEKHPVTG
jgi:predicted GNAT family acetyltransferase